MLRKVQWLGTAAIILLTIWAALEPTSKLAV